MKYFTELQTLAFSCSTIGIIFATVVFGSISSAAAGAANFGIRFDNTLCLRDMRTWKKFKGWKAIAITRTVGIAQGCETIGGFESRTEAKKRALSACNVNVKYPTFQGRASCRIVALEK